MLPFAVSLHFIGVAFKLYLLPTEMFVENLTPHHGAVWFWILLFSLPQIWLCRDVLRGKFNCVGRVTYDDTKNSNLFILFCKIGVPLISFVVVPVVATTMVYLRTTSNETGDRYASHMWLELIFALGWPVGMFGALWASYLVVADAATPSVY